MKDELILFDWGNIVESHTTGYSCSIAWNDLFKKCGYKGNNDIFYEISKYRLCSITNTDDFKKSYQQIKNDFNLTSSFDEFIYYYKNVLGKIDYYKDVANYEISLHDKCYIGIFSDLTIFDKERLNKQVNLLNYDYIFLSYEFGLQKSDIELFNIVNQKLPFKPENILFIDDKKSNIELASKLGWNVLHTTGLEIEKIKEKCEEFLM